MLAHFKSFDGVSLPAGVKIYIVNPHAMPGAAPVFIAQAQADSEYSGAYTVDVRNVALRVAVTDYANRTTLAGTIKRMFKRGRRGDLVATFADDGNDYLLDCVVVTPPSAESETAYTVVLQTGMSAWRRQVADTDSMSLTLTGGSKTISVGGNDETRLSVTLKSTGGASVGYTYQRLYQLPAVAGVNNGVRPWRITLDTAALVSASKMQADCDDLRIMVNGAETPRWIADANTSETKIWFNAPIGMGYALKLKTAIAGAGAITMVEFLVTAQNKEALRRMPAAGIIVHGTEWISYRGKIVNATTCALKARERGAYGTTLQAHNANDMFSFIPAAIVMRYGNSTVGNPATDDPHYDDAKPVFDLAASDNGKWVYTSATKFFDAAQPNRPGAWTPILQRLGDVSNTYDVKANAESGDPALGGMLGCFTRNGQTANETGRAGWQMMAACGINRVSMTLRKWRNSTRWPAIAGCQRSADGAAWYSVFNEALPTTVDSWIDITKSAVSVAAGSRYLFFGLDGKIQKLADALAMIEALTTTVEFVTANLPSGSLLAEVGSFSMDLQIKNQTNGDVISLDYPLLLHRDFALDGEERTVTLDGVNLIEALRLDDEGRSVWIRLAPGDNVIEVSSADVGTLEATFSWYARRL
ncbi:MAG: phage tail family protein [Bryobacterales bacterium]|nr:phage tail family protein [Bryobacterales bacterium]MCZ2288584.1 phage tail family protein [Anaerolineales bacterium]